MDKQKQKATIGVALVPVIILIILLALANMVNNVWETGWIDAHIPLLFGALAAALISMFVLNYRWAELESGIIDLIKSTLPAIIILLVIGCLTGTWLASGIVPAMIYYGIQIISPSVFLVVTLILCSIVSLATGSSWTTAATVGVALMGVGQGLGVPIPVIGGCIISGAYFGDKMSPLSDTTNLAPAVSGSNLFDHIRHMVYTTTPAYVVALIAFGVMGVRYSRNALNTETVEAMMSAISNTFVISPFLLIVPLLVIVMVVMKIPAFPGLFAGGIIGGIIAMTVQKVSLIDTVNVMHYGFESSTGNELIDNLLSGGGLDSMMWTISLVLCALVFGGIMEKTGMLNTIGESLLKMATRTGDLIAATILTAIAMNFVSGDQYLAIVVPGRMFKIEFDKRGLHPKNLSRTLEDSATLSSPLVPWNSCGAFMIATLGLAPWTYIPYAILNWVTPIVAIIYGYTGFSIEKIGEKEEEAA